MAKLSCTETHTIITLSQNFHPLNYFEVFTVSDLFAEIQLGPSKEPS